MIAPVARTRRARAVGLLLAVALAASATACNPGRPPAAVVGSIDIAPQRVDDLVAAFAATDDAFRDDIEGQGRDTYATAWAADALRILVSRASAAHVASERGVIVDGNHQMGARDELARTLLPDDPDTGTAVVDALPEGTREWLLDLTAAGLALQADLAAGGPVSADVARSYWERSRQFDQVCLRLLVVAPDDVDAVRDRIDAGEDFGDLSAELSVDPQVAEARGGSPDDCALLSQLQQQLQGEPFQQIASVPDGGVVGPFQYDQEGNAVLVDVSPREKVPFEDLVEDLSANLPPEAHLEIVLRQELAEMEIRIDPRFGRWDPDELVVVPPAAGL